MRLSTSVNILGQEYSVQVVPYGSDPMFLDGETNGYTDLFEHRIVVQDAPDGDTENVYAVTARCLRHEVVHAFLEESGLSSNWTHQTGQDETIVDWIAVQWNKMEDVISDISVKLMQAYPPRPVTTMSPAYVVTDDGIPDGPTY